MRFTLRALPQSADRPTRRPSLRVTAVVAAVVTAVMAILAIVGVTSTAEAQQPTAATVPVAAAVPAATAARVDLLSGFNAAINRRAAAAARAEAAAHAARVQQVRARVVKIAKAQIGDRYVAGAAGPSRFDCSGLTRYVFRVAAGKDLPHQSHAQYSKVKKIRFADARPGDLVFFFRNGAHHVGVYIGNKRMVDAAGYGEGVRISPITGSWWSRSYSGMGRILPV